MEEVAKSHKRSAGEPEILGGNEDNRLIITMRDFSLEYRTCAVYGGVYVLDQGLASYKLDTETGRCTSVVTDQGQEFRCRWVVAGMDYLNRSWLPNSDDNR